MAHLLPESELVWLVREMDAPPLKIVKLNQEFDQLEAYESEDKRQELASRIVSAVREVVASGDLSDQHSQRIEYLEDAMKKALFDTLNPAQRYVMELVFRQLA